MKREDALRLPELIDKRSLNERHFQRPDGQIEVIIQRNQNYLSGGKWKKREDFKLSQAGGEIINESNHLNIRVKNNRIKVNNDWFEIEGLYLDDILLDTPLNLNPTYNDDTVIFSEIFSGIDIEFLVTPHRIKETIIIRKNPLLGRFVSGEKLFVKYKTSNKQQFRGVWAKDQRRSIEALEKWDKKDYYLGVSKSDLNRAAYPIEIDPTITPIPSSDANVFYDNITASYTRTDSVGLICGRDYSEDGKGTVTSNKINRSYVRFDLTSVSSDASAAQLFLTMTGGAATTISVRQSSSEIDPETGDAATIFSNSTGTQVATVVLTTVNSTVGTTESFLSYINSHRGGFCDFGLMGDEVSAVTPITIASSEHATTAYRPYLSITYGAVDSAIKTVSGLAKASVKTVNGLAIANVKTWNGLN